MTTTRTLVTDALKLIGVAGQGEDLENEEANDAIRLLNQMLSVWSIEGTTVPISTITEIPLTGASSYTIGPSGADVTMARPIDISAAQVLIGNTTDPLEKLSEDRWGRVSIGQGHPCRFWYHDTYPSGTLRLDTTGYSGTLRIFSEQPIGTLALDDTISLPDEYMLPITYSLAVLAVPAYEADVSQANLQTIASIASSSKAVISTHNVKVAQVQLEPAVLGRQGGRFDIDSGIIR